ncbi:hypothetical protein [Rhodanobacter lindaniclasticus]
MQPITYDLCIPQGATLAAVLQWFSADAVHKIISHVTIGLPTLVTATAHGLTGTGRQPVWITNVKGPRALNTDGYRDACPRWATVVDADTLAVDVDTGSAQAWQSGGVLTYYPPVDLGGYTARMQVRASVAAADVLLELTTENGGITLDSDGTVTLQASATATAAMAWTRGVYDLELVDGGGVVTRLAAGSVEVSREVTREDAI